MEFWHQLDRHIVMNVLIVIPARMGSQRFPAKALAQLQGPDGTRRSLVEWTWRAGLRAASGGQLVVATDDEAIVREVEGFGGRAVMTAVSLRNGTERCAAMVERLGELPDVIVNLQGDSPLVPAAMIDALVGALQDPGISVATVCVPADDALRAMILEESRAGRVGGTCAVVNARGQAVYFSKHPIPFSADGSQALRLHVGLYAYRPSALAAYLANPPCEAELAEGLEQLRFLHMGLPVQVVEVPLPDGGLWEVNNPSDIPIVEALLPA